MGLQQLLDEFDRVCSNCGNTYGSHRAGPPGKKDQCPETEGRMDWDDEHPTFFKEKK